MVVTGDIDDACRFWRYWNRHGAFPLSRTSGPLRKRHDGQTKDAEVVCLGDIKYLVGKREDIK